ncbi:hypothetical protein J1N35_010002 [Gossypium stocksii]|uniref:Uncharacterized protein n=1 Tax=Gossypium stocksii TaxID=47602 RepID=A0A9D3VZK4_9ROSI|nr:hypothetical protein J1N35_010002 [Gossypium stocksii]
MSSSRGKRTVALPSKKCNGPGGSLSRPTSEARHPFITFPQDSQEELFQILRARTLSASRCINWAALEHVNLADAVRALLMTDPWEQFFRIIEPTYLELTLEFCSTFYLQTVMSQFDDPGTGYPPYDPSRMKATALTPSLRYLHTLLTHTLTASDRATSQGGHIHGPVHYTLGPSLRAPQHSGLDILIHTRRPDVPSGHLDYAPYEDDLEAEDLEDIPDNVPPPEDDAPTDPPPPRRSVHAAASHANISERLSRFEQQCFQRFDHIDATLQQICQHLHITSPPPPRDPFEN